MPPPSSQSAYIPSVRARNLAARLKEFREAAGLSQKRAADSLSWSAAKIGHIETGRNKASFEDVELLLELYGVVGPDRDAILRLAQEADHRSWWTEFVDVLHGPYVALEDAASEIVDWSPQLIPGLLQTPGYARALIVGDGSNIEPSDIERRLQTRLLRQAILARPEPPRLHVVLDQSCLERPIGGPGVMKEQLARLVADSQRDHITIQILPREAGNHPGLEGAMIVLRFADPSYPDVGYCEGFFGAVYLENPHQVSRCNVAFEQISKAALKSKDSVALIEAAATTAR